MRPIRAQPGPNRQYLLFVALFIVALYVLAPQLHAFRSSWHLLSHPLAGWVLLAVGLTALTYLAAALTYCLLASRPLPYSTTVLAELAAMFVNRLLPGGVGALGVNYAYLRRHKHTAVQAGSIVALNNLLGVVGHTILLGLAVAISGGDETLPVSDSSLAIIFKVLAAVFLVGATLGLIFRRGQLHKALREVEANLLSYRQRPLRLPGALASSMGLTLCNVLCLASCALALGVHLPFAAILIIFSFGVGTATAVPTPGGLGGFEAGLTAGLVAYRLPGSTALAIALLYRLVSYWLPLVAGAGAFGVSQRRHLFSLRGA